MYGISTSLCLVYWAVWICYIIFIAVWSLKGMTGRQVIAALFTETALHIMKMVLHFVCATNSAWKKVRCLHFCLKRLVPPESDETVTLITSHTLWFFFVTLHNKNSSKWFFVTEYSPCRKWSKFFSFRGDQHILSRCSNSKSMSTQGHVFNSESFAMWCTYPYDTCLEPRQIKTP